MGRMVYIHTYFYTPFITVLFRVYFYTCLNRLSPMAVHNPHELSTDLSTIHTPFPHVETQRLAAVHARRALRPGLYTVLWTECITLLRPMSTALWGIITEP